MTIASTPTLLSLDRFAKIIGYNPIHWAGAVTGGPFPLTTACSDVMAQYAWQTPEQMVSREEIAYQIAQAEHDIKELLGYSPAPDWEYREQHRWPGGYARQAKRFRLNYGKLIAPGVRGATAIEADASVVYSDPDADTFNELATVTVATALTDPREIKLFFAGKAGMPEWEIRPLRAVTISGGFATITADSWLFINPDEWGAYPTNDEGQEIDISTTDNYVETVDVYRIYNDTSAFGATFLIDKPGALALGFCYQCGYGTCLNCGATTQGGTFSIFDSHSALVVPYPAAYVSDTWRGESFADCGVPRLAAFHYYAGEEDKRYAQSQRLDPLSDFWASTITWLAVARLPRGVCGCDNVRQRIEEAQRDLTQNTTTDAFIRTDRMDIFRSAFGTRAGEVRAWQAVTRLINDQVAAGGAI